MIGLWLFFAVVSVVILLHHLLTRTFANKIFRNPFSKFLFYVSAIIGTPIHEASHALMAILFGHKVHKICWFQVGKDGRLGYVEHNWNRRSLYQSIGCIFIALAPLASAFAVITLLYHFMNMPSLPTFVLDVDVANVYTVSMAALQYCWHASEVLLNHALSSPRAGLSLLVASLICFHCIPSKADFNNALKGSVIVIALVTVLWGLSLYFNLFHQQWMLAAFNFSVNVSSFVLITSVLSMCWWFILVLPSVILRS
ncbi:hypothetical protein [Vibrio gangliei]|uniref:hypothetical protein n=1 Tax=Vibrio gangliei TaxID=2077090 RepID=UPI000D018459|nr:hypothetical protein [Vibrio gangliei]